MAQPGRGETWVAFALGKRSQGRMGPWTHGRPEVGTKKGRSQEIDHAEGDAVSGVQSGNTRAKEQDYEDTGVNPQAEE